MDDLHSGALSLDDARIQSDIQAAPQCTFAADYSGISQQPHFQDNGSPGDPGFNVNLVSLALHQPANLVQPCTGSQVVTGVTMNTDQGLAIGARTTAGSAAFDLPNSASFTTVQGLFQFTLTSFGTRTATASYRYVMTNSADPQDVRVLVVTGSFSMPR